MSAGFQGSTVATVTYDDGSGTPVAVGTMIVEGFNFKETNENEPTHGLGSTAPVSTPTGFTRYDDFKLKGKFKTGSGLAHAVFKPNANDKDPNGTLRTIVFGLGDSVTVTGETRLLDYQVTSQNEKLTEFEVTIRASGIFTWAP